MKAFAGISKRSLLLMMFDIYAVTAAFALGFYIRTGALPDFGQPKLLPLWGIYVVILISAFYIFDLYYPFKYFKKGQTFVEAVLSVCLGMAVAEIIAYRTGTLILPRLIFVYANLALIPLIYGVRIVYDLLFQSRFLDHRVLILGSGHLAQQIVEVIRKTPHSGMELIGAVAESNKSPKKNLNGVPIVGPFSNLISLIDWYNINLVVLALDTNEKISEAAVIAEILGRRVAVTSSIHLFERLTGYVPYELFGDHYLLGLMAQVKVRPYLKLKRLLDILSGILLLLLLSPVLLLSVAVLLFSGLDKIFFIQKRIGLDGAPFNLIKLRSMETVKGSRVVITKMGRFMRKYRIDEIPQLLNVIKGDMSLVGPRPEIPYFVAKCRKRIPFYDVVFTVEPGLTGWAQVNYGYTRSLKDYKEKFRYNLYYLKNISFPLDLLILLRTVRIILLGKGQ